MNDTVTDIAVPDIAATDILAAEIELPCSDVQETLAFFVGTLGFRLHVIFPADDPAVASLSGHGLRLRLVRGLDASPGTIRIMGDRVADPMLAPNGTRIEFVPMDPWPVIPEGRQSLTFSPPPTETEWGTGRAGMQYRDLIPDRWGGRFIASHIRIPNGGPVPDYVHFHKVRFQMIFCYKGWVRLVYEDQGDPFIMRAGECVLQPPEIRHRVLEASDGLEVVEIGCPADHPTHVDHILPLPTGMLRPERDFNGQRFVFHQLQNATWTDWEAPGYQARDLGIKSATDGLATVQVVRYRDGSAQPPAADGEFHFIFCLAGQATIDAGDMYPLQPGASLAIPTGTEWHILDPSAGFEFLELRM